MSLVERHATRTGSALRGSYGLTYRGSPAACTCSRRLRTPPVVAQMTPELYAELLTFLRRFYEVILLDLGTT